MNFNTLPFFSRVRQLLDGFADPVPRSSMARRIPVTGSDSDTDDMDVRPSARRRSPIVEEPDDDQPSDPIVIEDDDADLQAAIQASIADAQAQKRTRMRPDAIVVPDDDDEELQRVLELSKMETGQADLSQPATQPARAAQPPAYSAPRPSSPPRRRPSDEDADLQEAIRRSMAGLDGDVEDTDYVPQPLQREDSHTRIRRTQDWEYQESLRQDRLKEAQRQAAEDAARAEAARVEAEARAAQQAQQERERLRQQKLARLPAEPAEGQPDTTSLMIRFPGGERFSRRFSLNNTLQDVHDFLDTRDEVEAPAKYHLASTFPRRVYGDQELTSTLRDLNLANAALNVIGIADA